MTSGPQRRVALFVERSYQQWIVRDPEGNFWLLPAVDDPWGQRQPFSPTTEPEMRLALSVQAIPGSNREISHGRAGKIIGRFCPITLPIVYYQDKTAW